MMSRYGAGTEDRDVNLLLRLVDVGGAEEERHVVAAGFRVDTRAGPNWVVTGPMSGLPKLLESDRIIYVEGAPYPDNAVSVPSPHATPRAIPILRPKPVQESPSGEPSK
jgi:hypothetical protein